jgi:hypothetical protein
MLEQDNNKRTAEDNKRATRGQQEGNKRATKGQQEGLERTRGQQKKNERKNKRVLEQRETRQLFVCRLVADVDEHAREAHVLRETRHGHGEHLGLRHHSRGERVCLQRRSIKTQGEE